MRRRMSFAAVLHLALAASARAGAANACTSAVCAQGQALEYDCCVVGAGPGGLQLGELLRTAGRSYAIFEQGTGPGSFFETFPRHRRLVSLNKRFTGSARACAMHAVGCTSYILAAGVHASRRAVLRGHAPARHVRGSARARVAGAGSPRLSPRHTPSISCKLKSTHQTCSPASMHDGPGCLCVSMQLKLTPPLTGNACLACMRMPPRPRLARPRRRADGEYNLRHDWNSLLGGGGAPQRMPQRTSDRWPHADDYAGYLKDYARPQEAAHRIWYGTRVRQIERHHGAPRGRGWFGRDADAAADAKQEHPSFAVQLTTAGHNDDGVGATDATVVCGIVVIAAGLGTPNAPASIRGLRHTVGYEDLPETGAAFQGQSVAVLGVGDAAAETAAALAPFASYVHVIPGRPRRHGAADQGHGDDGDPTDARRRLLSAPDVEVLDSGTAAGNMAIVKCVCAACHPPFPRPGSVAHLVGRGGECKSRAAASFRLQHGGRA